MRETMISDAMSVHTISMEEFDTDPYIFNCKDGKVHCVFTGKKILVDLDDLIKYFSGESENIA